MRELTIETIKETSESKAALIALTQDRNRENASLHSIKSLENPPQNAVRQQPEPLPSLPDVKAFDYAYLPTTLRDYVKDISERMQCPPDFAAVGAIVMIASIVGRKVSIRPMKNNDWTVIPNLWGTVVGNSGIMKSPTLSEVLSPIKKLQALAFDEFNNAKAEYETNSELIKIQNSVAKSNARKAVKDSNSAGTLKILKPEETPDAENEPPILKRYMTNNATYEAFGELLIENPNGLLVEADELIGLLKQLDSNGQEVARSFYLTAADGDQPYTFDRIMRGKGLHIPALCLSIIGGIQPGVLAEYVRQATSGGIGADGLLQRFGLMVYPDINPEWEEVDRYPDKEARDSVTRLVEKLDGLKPFEIGAEEDAYDGVPFLRFDGEAQALFSEWRGKLEQRLRSGEEHPAIVSHLSKYRKLIPSLALIFHLCDTGHGAVRYEALLSAIAFGEYLESHA
jgi:putative DNA primase/helicase